MTLHHHTTYFVLFIYIFIFSFTRHFWPSLLLISIYSFLCPSDHFWTNMEFFNIVFKTNNFLQSPGLYIMRPLPTRFSVNVLYYNKEIWDEINSMYIKTTWINSKKPLPQKLINSSPLYLKLYNAFNTTVKYKFIQISHSLKFPSQTIIFFHQLHIEINHHIPIYHHIYRLFSMELELKYHLSSVISFIMIYKVDIITYSNITIH